jgi:hypothetical protein
LCWPGCACWGRGRDMKRKPDPVGILLFISGTAMTLAALGVAWYFATIGR